jgi:uncharacterized membrane protein
VSEETHFEKISSALFGQSFPADLALVIFWLAAGIAAIYLPLLSDSPLRIVLTLPVVLFIPGYCLVAALFPKEEDIDLAERIMLSTGISIAVVSLVGLGLNFTPWGIRLEPVVVSVTLFTWVMILIAIYRRGVLPPEERFRMPFSILGDRIFCEFFPRGGGTVDRALGFLLPLAAVVAILTTAFVIAFPQNGERFTEFYILGENRTATGFPDTMVPEMSYPLFIGVGNQEYRAVSYTVEIWSLRTEFDTVTNFTHIRAMDPVDRLPLALAHNETRIVPYELSVRKTGYDRIEFLLFNETVPGGEVTGTDRINASYRALHLWVNRI